ncbi:MAG: ATP-binding protein [Chloroflexota bacterium]
MLLELLTEIQAKIQLKKRVLPTGSWSILEVFLELDLLVSTFFCVIFFGLALFLGGNFLFWLALSFGLLTFGEGSAFILFHFEYYQIAAAVLGVTLGISALVVVFGAGLSGAAPAFFLFDLLLGLSATFFVTFSKAALWGHEPLQSTDLMVKVGRLENDLEIVRATLDSLEEGLLLTDIQDKVLYVNRRLSALFGLRSETIRHKKEVILPYSVVTEWINQVRAVTSNPDEFKSSLQNAREMARLGETNVFIFGVEKPNSRYRASEPLVPNPRLTEGVTADTGGSGRSTFLRPNGLQEGESEVLFERDSRPLLYREMKLTVFPVLGVKGNLLGTCYLARDITDEREVEQIKENFISIVSHEVRTPMAVILGLTELLSLPDVEKSEQDEWVKAINQEALRMRTVLNDMQSISRITDGAFEMSLEEVALPELIERVIKVSQLQYRSQHTVTTECDLPQTTIYADRGKITQVFTNLVGNAIKYTPEKGEIKVRLGTRPNHPNQIYISVTDQGIGIPKSEQHKVFSRFFRSTNTRQKGIGGTGLGLAITQHLVKLMGGTVWFESEENRGSTFYFSLPLVERENSVLEEPVSSSQNKIRG